MSHVKQADQLAGITPIVLRRAGYYLSLGLGEYYPDHPHYDKVLVESTYTIQPNTTDEAEWALGITVSFFQDNRRIRWIDFNCRTTGAGGDSILREVHPNE